MRIAGKIATVAGLLIFAGLGGHVAYAQFEVNPDRFNSPNSEPFENGNVRGKPTPARANARSTQPHCSQCTGNASAKGSNQTSPAFSRKLRRVTLIQKGPGATGSARPVETSLHQ
jgi:hypothetical protein